eukprot:2810038-Amphidinium_carterae.2
MELHKVGDEFEMLPGLTRSSGSKSFKDYVSGPFSPQFCSDQARVKQMDLVLAVPLQKGLSETQTTKSLITVYMCESALGIAPMVRVSS